MRPPCFLRLPFERDLSSLLQDLTYGLCLGRLQHHPADDQGGWQSLALRSAGGKSWTVFPQPQASYEN